MNRTISWLSRGLLTFAVLFSITAYAGNSIYKWVDENGNVHYGDMKPDGTKAEQMKIRRFKSQAASPNPIKQAQQLEQKKETAAKLKASELQKQLEAKAEEERCQTAKKNFQILKNNARVKIRDKEGYRYLTPEEMSQKIQEAKQAINESCK